MKANKISGRDHRCFYYGMFKAGYARNPMPAQPQAGVIDASFPMWCEFGSKKAAAIPAHMVRCRALAYTGIALRAAPAHLNRTGLAFSNPSTSSENQIRPTLASGFALRYARVQTFSVASSEIKWKCAVDLLCYGWIKRNRHRRTAHELVCTKIQQ